MIHGSNNGANHTTLSGLISYPAKLGLGDEQLADVISLLQVMRGGDLLKKPYGGRYSFAPL